MKVFNRLLEDKLLGVRFAVNVFIASIIVWITLRLFTHANPIWAIASMIASSEPVVKQGLKMFRSRLIRIGILTFNYEVGLHVALSLQTIKMRLLLDTQGTGVDAVKLLKLHDSA